MKFYECSAKTNVNIAELFTELTSIVLAKRKLQGGQIDKDLLDGAVLVPPSKTEQKKKDACCS